MANYVSLFRSSYFKVRDVGKFREFCDEYELELITTENDQYGTLYGFMQREDSEIGIPSVKYDPEIDDYIDANFEKDLAKHLEEGWAAEIREIGYENMRYLFGVSIIVAWDGSIEALTLDDIHVFTDWINDVKLTACEY